MSDAVDTRIVEVKFDASDFEKGVNKTVKKLDELKSKLEMKDTGKSITEFGKKTSEEMEKATGALEKLSDRFTSFTGMIKQGILGGLANEVSNAFLKIEQSITGLFRELGSSQVSAGMNKYTEILNSVRTMTASGVSESSAYEAVKRLAEYSDQTSYSLSQMTSGMSKLVAAGAKLEDAEKMMEGLANMSASAGVNIYDAQRAFTNFSQAYSSGSMRIQDWMSIESLNMASKQVMEVFIEAGVQTGRLTKEVKKNGEEIVKTSNKVNKKIKANKQVATNGFRDTLSSGWLDQETMKQATAVLSYFDDLGVSLNELSSDQLKEFSAKAFQAAKEARSFADVLGTVKDVVSTGWATTFEKIFGQLSEATKFFTWLSESNLANAIYSISEFRNGVLELWNSYGNSDFGETGSQRLIQAFQNIDSAIGILSNAFKKILPTTTKSAVTLWTWTYKFQQFTSGIREWLRETVDFVDEGGKKVLKSRADKIAEAFSVIGSGLNIAADIISTAWNIIKTVFEAFEPTFDAITNALGTFADSIDEMRENTTIFKDLENSVQNLLIVAQPLLDVLPTLVDIASTIGSFFLNMAIDTLTMNVQLFADALGLIIEIFGGDSAQKMRDGEGVLGGIKEDITSIGTACSDAIGAVKEFFTTLFGDIRNLLGLGEQVEGQDGGIFSGIKNFFDTNEFVQNAKAWINQAVADIGAWINDIPKKIKNAGSIISKFWNSLFYGEDTKRTSKKSGDTMLPGEVKKFKVATPLKKWIDQAVKDVADFIKNIPLYINSGLTSVGNILNAFVGALFGKENGEPVTSADIVAALKAPFEGITLGTIIAEIKNIGKNILNGVISIFTGTTDIDANSETFANVVSNGIALIKQKASETWAAIEQWFIDLPQTIAGWFSGDKIAEEISAQTEDTSSIESAISEFGNTVGVFITTTLPSIIQTAFETATRMIGGFWDNLYKVITGQTDDKQKGAKDAAKTAINKAAPGESEVDTSKWQELFTSIGIKLRDMVLNLPKTITQAFEMLTTIVPVGKWISSVGSWISELWTGIHEEVRTDTQGNKYTYIEKNIGIKDRLIEFAGSIGDWIKNDLPVKVKNAFTTAKDKLPEIWTTVTNWVTGLWEGIDWTAIQNDAKGIGNKIVGFFKDIVFGPETEVTEYLNDEGRITTVMKRSGGLGEKIGEFITGTVPEALKNAWEWVGSQASVWQSSIENILDEHNINWDTIQAKAIEIGEKLGGFVKEIPNYITPAFGFIKDVLFGKETEVTEYLNDEGRITTVMKRSGGLWDVFKNLFSSAGPVIVDGINSALTWAGDKIDWLSTLIGNQEGGESKNIFDRLNEAAETNEFAAAVIRLGETLKRIIVETIPGFITAAFNEIKISLPSLLSKLFGDIFGTGEEAQGPTKEEAEKAVQNMQEQFGILTADALIASEDSDEQIYTAIKEKASIWKSIGKTIQELSPVSVANAEGEASDAEKKIDVLSGVMDALKNFGEKASVASVAISLVAISWILEAITDIFTFADEVEAVSHGIAWAGIGVAIAGFGFVLAQIGILAGQTEETADGVKNVKLDYLMDKLSSIGDFFTGIADRIIAIVAIFKGLDLIDTLAEIFTTKGKAANMIKSGLSGLAGVGLGAGLGGLLTSIVESLISGIGPALNDLSVEIQNFAEIIGPGLAALSNMSNQLEAVITVPEKLNEFITKFYDLGFTMFEKNNDTYIDYILGIGTFLNNLGTGLNNFSKVKDPTTVLQNMLSFVSDPIFDQIISEMHDSVMNWAGSTWDPNSIRNMSLEFELLGNAFSIFGNDIAALNPSSVKALDDTLKTFNTLADTFSSRGTDAIDMMTSGKVSIFGRELQQFAVSMKYFSKYINEIDLNAIDNTVYTNFQKKIDLAAYTVTSFIEATQGLYNDASSAQFNMLIGILPSLSEPLKEFINGLNEGLSTDIDLSKMKLLESAVNIFGTLTYSANLLEVTNIDRALEKVTEFAGKMFGVFEVEGYEHDVPVTEWLQKIITAFNTVAGNMSDGIQPTLTPVVDTAALDSQLRTYFSSNTFDVQVQASLDAAISAGALNLKIPEPINYRGQLSTIEGQISALSGRVGELAAAISRQPVTVNVNGANTGYDWSGRRNTSMG